MKKIIIFCIMFFASTLNAADLKLVTANEPPTNFEENGVPSGIITDMVVAIAKEVGQSTKVNLWPWARSYEVAKKEPNTLIFTCGKSQERIDLGFHFIGPIATRDHVLYAKKGGNYAIQSLEDIVQKGLKVGVLRGDWRSKDLTDKGITIDEVSDHALNPRKIMAGRVHLWATSDLEAPPIMKQNNLEMKELEVAFVLYKDRPSWMMISKGTDPTTIKTWEKAFLKLQSDGTFQIIAKKWAEKLGDNVIFLPEKGFFIEKG